MIISLKNQKKCGWDKSSLKKTKKIISFVDVNKFENRNSQDIERQERMKSDKFIYSVSKPVFNKKKNILFIQSIITLINFVPTTYIYKKEKGVWIKIASYYPNEQ